jgi:hypothetical protein
MRSPSRRSVVMVFSRRAMLCAITAEAPSRIGCVER